MSQENLFVQALSSLPHGKEFWFVDEIQSMEPGISGTATWVMKGSEDFLRGHFPGMPIMPGVIMIEALAQLTGVVVQSARLGNPLQDVRLTAVRQFKILGTISPGEQLQIQVKVDAIMGGLIQASGSLTKMDGTMIGTGSIILSGTEPSC